MAELYLPVDVEALVSAFLREQPEIVDDVADRVYTELPKSPQPPMIRVTLLLDRPMAAGRGATPGGPLWGLSAAVQVEAWGSKAQAFRIAATARAAIDTRLAGVYEGRGVVAGVTTGPMMDQPDTSFDPARPRFLFTSTIHTRPVGSVAS